MNVALRIFTVREKSRSSALNASRSVGWNERPGTRVCDPQQRDRANTPWNTDRLKCWFGVHFWTAETCLRFGFTVKNKSAVEKSFAMVVEQRSQSAVLPAQSIWLPARPRALAHFCPKR